MSETNQNQQDKKLETIVLGGGCFWCLDAVYANVQGVTSVESGYSNGQVQQPSYEQVCTGRTGHNEVVKLEYDPAQISLREILEIFFVIHDPTTLNRQGNDVGTQYRSGIYFDTPAQKDVADDLVRELNGGNRVVPTVVYPDGSHDTNPDGAEVAGKMGMFNEG